VSVGQNAAVAPTADASRSCPRAARHQIVDAGEKVLTLCGPSRRLSLWQICILVRCRRVVDA